MRTRWIILPVMLLGMACSKQAIDASATMQREQLQPEYSPCVDPNGKTTPATDTDAGSSMDPNGKPAAGSGFGIDPNGKDGGPHMDPNGKDSGPRMDDNGKNKDSGPGMDPNGKPGSNGKGMGLDPNG